MVNTMEMNRAKIIAAATTGVLLTAGAAYTIVYADKEPPVVTVEKLELAYEEGTGTAPLLQGVGAYDNRDGDVTASVIVDSIISLGDGNQAKVMYAAKDRRNNIGTGYRIVAYIPRPEAEEAAGKEDAEKEADVPGSQADKSTQTNSSVSENRQEALAAEETEGVHIAAGAAAVIETEEEGNQAEATGNDREGEAEPRQENQQEETPPIDGDTANEAGAEAPAEAVPTGAGEQTGTGEGIPRIKLKTNYITMNEGDVFNSYAYIESAEDDKDNGMTMVKIEGEVETTKAGSYELKYYVRDRDGNKSNVEKLTVVVLPKQ